MVRFERPDYIHMGFHINDVCYDAYPQEALFELMETHPLLFPDFKKPALPYKPDYALVARKDEPYRDDFGCVGTTTCDGITGTVTGHPVKEPEDVYRLEIPKNRDGRLPHGFMYLRLLDLCGFENAMMMFAEEGEEI